MRLWSVYQIQTPKEDIDSFVHCTLWADVVRVIVRGGAKLGQGVLHDQEVRLTIPHEPITFILLVVNTVISLYLFEKLM